MHPGVVLNDSDLFRDNEGYDLARKINASAMYDVLPSFSQNLLIIHTMNYLSYLYFIF